MENSGKTAMHGNVFVQNIVVKTSGNNSLELQIVKYVHLRPCNVSLFKIKSQIHFNNDKQFQKDWGRGKILETIPGLSA